MKTAFCTIITADHLPYAKTLLQSICEIEPNDLYVLVADETMEEFGQRYTIEPANNSSHLHLIHYDRIVHMELANRLFDKYWKQNMDCYRWSMKSVFMQYLFEYTGIDKIIYVDCDIHFFNDYRFLFDALDSHNVLLSPHWRSSNPLKDAKNFDLLFVGGLYNGGFVAANRHAKDVMEWWANMCLYKCEKNFEKGHYVDQTYLNLMPIYFDKVKILKHKGCNVSNWNQIDCSRQELGGTILIDGKWEIIFIHFTKSTIYGILYGSDGKLMPYLEEYLNCLKMNGIEIELKPTSAEQPSVPPRSQYWRAKNWLNKKIKR